MQIHAFKGTGRVFGFTKDAAGSNLPLQYGPWSPFKTLDMSRGGESQPGVRIDECLDDIENHGIHITEAHVRITDRPIARSERDKFFEMRSGRPRAKAGQSSQKGSFVQHTPSTSAGSRSNTGVLPFAFLKSNLARALGDDFPFLPVP